MRTNGVDASGNAAKATSPTATTIANIINQFGGVLVKDTTTGSTQTNSTLGTVRTTSTKSSNSNFGTQGTPTSHTSTLGTNCTNGDDNSVNATKATSTTSIIADGAAWTPASSSQSTTQSTSSPQSKSNIFGTTARTTSTLDSDFGAASNTKPLADSVNAANASSTTSASTTWSTSDSVTNRIANANGIWANNAIVSVDFSQINYPSPASNGGGLLTSAMFPASAKPTTTSTGWTSMNLCPNVTNDVTTPTKLLFNADVWTASETNAPNANKKLKVKKEMVDIRYKGERKRIKAAQTPQTPQTYKQDKPEQQPEHLKTAQVWKQWTLQATTRWKASEQTHLRDVVVWKQWTSQTP